jgi:hypothetical protein
MLEDLTKAAQEFECHMSHGIMNGCVAALDGWLCRIHVPTPEVEKVKPYFSGHYQCYGLNVQATCDADCRFTSLSVLCPGSTSDNKAFYTSHVYNLVHELLDGFFPVADNAYTLSPTLLIPYLGQDKRDKSKDAFNFYLSQLRIRIEQAFGLLVTKWRIFKKPFEASFWWTTLLIEACFCLHKFCINERKVEVLNINTPNPESFTPSYAEHLDALEPGVSKSAKRNTVHEAIL